MKSSSRGPWTALRALCAALALGAFGSGCADLPIAELLAASGLGVPAGPLDEPTVVAGLREALRVGTERSVQQVGRENGYLGSRLIRIPLPEPLQRPASALRSIGAGALVDELEVSMNRAAERAAREAAPVFGRAITSLTFADARAILGGGERAATDFFEGRTRPELAQRFRPIVRSGMEEVGLVRLYGQFSAQLAQLPLVGAPRLDLDGYVTDGALDGLFRVLADEEGRIRRDPAARSTALLRRVFGGS